MKCGIIISIDTGRRLFDPGRVSVVSVQGNSDLRWIDLEELFHTAGLAAVVFQKLLSAIGWRELSWCRSVTCRKNLR